MGIYEGNPCKKCENREIGCHANCLDYKEWRAGVDMKKEIILNEHVREAGVKSYKVETAAKIMRAGGKRRNSK